MDTKEQILQHLDELLAEAETIFVGPDGNVDGSRWEAWRLSAQDMIAQLTESRSDYHTRFAQRATWVRHNPDLLFHPRTAVRLLQRVRDDYAGGHLRDLSELVAAEVFTDFLDMADHLLANGYHVPAASLAGAVVEEWLRRLHLKHVGPWQGDSSINKLNEGLRTANVYGQATWRQIQVWGDIRNKADHGEFAEVDATQVKQMLFGVRDFIARHEG